MMKKRILSALALAILLCIPYAFAVGYENYKSADMTIDIGSDFKVTSSTNDYTIDYITTEVSFMPRESSYQQVISLTETPDADPVGENLLFQWLRPEIKDYSFNINSKVKTNSDYGRVKSKIPFPMANIPEDIKKYTKPTINIDSNVEDIQLLASKIASGEDDSYVAVNNMGVWVENNVEYSLGSLTSDVSQKASWVLVNKKGVCDELTSLFIAMVRSVGIPARYVSGVAYTDFNNMNDWGPHAWAEVYFPEYGWVPFDVTYKQLGHVDPSHIILKYSADSDESSTNYEWKARNIDIKTSKLNMDVRETGKQLDATGYISLDAGIEKDSARFGSYNLVEVTVKNLNDFYYSADVYLANVNDITIYGDMRKNVVLKPKEEKKVYWKIKLSDNLDDRFVYTIPIYVYTQTNISSRVTFTSKKDDPYYSNDKISEIIKQKEEESQKSYSREISLECRPAKEFYYFYDSPMIDCEITNKGNSIIEGLDVCIGKESCRKIDLGISQKKVLNYSVTVEKPGTKNIVISATNSLVSKTVNVDLKVFDDPKIIIDEIYYPESVKFKDHFNVSFLAKKSSESNPKNVQVLLKNRNAETAWTIDDMGKDERFLIDIFAKTLRNGENEFEITVAYYDLNAKSYEEKESFKIILEKPTIIQRLYLWALDTEYWLESLFK